MSFIIVLFFKSLPANANIPVNKFFPTLDFNDIHRGKAVKI